MSHVKKSETAGHPTLARRVRWRAVWVMIPGESRCSSGRPTSSGVQAADYIKNARNQQGRSGPKSLQCLQFGDPSINRAKCTGRGVFSEGDRGGPALQPTSPDTFCRVATVVAGVVAPPNNGPAAAGLRPGRSSQECYIVTTPAVGCRLSAVGCRPRLSGSVPGSADGREPMAESQFTGRVAQLVRAVAAATGRQLKGLNLGRVAQLVSALA